MSDELDDILNASEQDYSDDDGLWPGDTGTLSLASRRALLHLIRGPMINADTNRELWQALLNDRLLISSRLSDLLLQLIVKEEDGIAFAQNAPAADMRIPKAVRNQPLTLIDTLLVLTLRRELMIGSTGRVFVGRKETFGTLAQYRPLSKLDEAAFRNRLERSWNKLVSAGILLKTDVEERCEVSPVLKLIFGADEVKAVNDAFDALLKNPHPPEKAPHVNEEAEVDGEGTNPPQDAASLEDAASLPAPLALEVNNDESEEESRWWKTLGNLSSNSSS